MIWNNYKNILYDTLDMNVIHSSNHSNKDSKLESKLYTGKYILKSRETYVESGENEYIYNNIIYPKTGKNLPCFGIDLMAFMEKKVIIVFDFQHPTENYDFNHSIVEESLKDYAGITKDIRFFQPGNHFSRYIYVKKCTIHEVDNYLEDFTKYVKVYNKLLDSSKPINNEENEFIDFDTYMHKLDPVIGFMEIRFGKEFAKNYVNNFLFSYAKVE
jgi:hypothetical protein